MMKNTSYRVVFALVLGVLGACDATIHEYPNPKKASVVVELNADRSAPGYYKQVVYDYDGNAKVTDLDPMPASDYIPDENVDLRFIVEIYNTPPGKAGKQVLPFARRVVSTSKDKTAPQDTVHFELPDGNYTVLAWGDYVPEGSRDDWHFETSTLTGVEEKKPEGFARNERKDAAAGNQTFAVDFTLSPSGYASNTVPVFMKRASGRFHLIANDLKEFVEAGGEVEKLQVKIVYRQYVSTGYNVATQQPNRFVQTRSYNTLPNKEATPGEDSVLLLAYDYILASTGKEDHVMVDIHVYDAENNEINYYEGVDVPLCRNRETMVYGPFLTKKKGTGGIGVDDNFDGEHTVVVKD